MISVNPVILPVPDFAVLWILAMWALATVIEAPIWVWLFANRLKHVRWFFVFGWMAFVQAVSTPLSLVLAVLIFLPFASVFLSWVTLLGPDQLLFAATRLMTNPVGVPIAFLLCPIFLEAFLWKVSWHVQAHQPAVGKAVSGANLWLHDFLAAAFIANGLSFAAGLVLSNPFPVTPIYLWLAVGWVLAIPLVLAAT